MSNIKQCFRENLQKTLDFESASLPEVVDPGTLIGSRRSDLYVKIFFVRCFLLGGARWAEEFYLEHIALFNGFVEGDGTGKIGKRAFLDGFKALIESYQCKGHCDDESLIPVDRNGVIIDGAHRVSAAYVLNIPITIVRFDFDSSIYDFDYFKKQGGSAKFLEQLLLLECEFNQKIHLLFKFPVVNSFHKEFDELVESASRVLYKKTVSLTEVGRKNFIRELYKGEAWVGGDNDETLGFLHHVYNRFDGGRPVVVYFICIDNVAEAVLLKAKIRSLYSLGNDPVHINDTHAETVSLSRLLLNQNSIEVLDLLSNKYMQQSSAAVYELKAALENMSVSPDQFCLSGSFPLMLLGGRLASDVDYVSVDGREIAASAKFGLHNDQLVYINVSASDLVYDPLYHFYFDGIKVISLELFVKLKRNRGEAKDVQDIELLSKRKNRSTLLSQARSYLLYLGRLLFSVGMVKKIFPKSTHNLLRAVYKRLL